MVGLEKALKEAVEAENIACEKVANARAEFMNRLGSDAKMKRTMTHAEIQGERVLEAKEIAQAIKRRREGSK